MIKKFYDLFRDSYVQTFDDTKKNRSGFTRVFPMTEIKQNSKWLLEMNKQGMGIFFTPNPCKDGRKEVNVTDINWIYVDMDEGTKDEMMARIKESQFFPNIITESSRSYHLYWKVKATKEQFTKLINGLIYFYHGDPAISSTNEVLRLPPFMHMKNPSNPFKVEIIYLDMGKEYSVDEMLEAYPEPHKEFQVKFKLQDDELGILKQISVVDVLRKLNVDVRRNSIFENGTETSAKINTQGNYITRFSGKPGSGSTIDAAMTYGNMELKDAIAWLKKEFNIQQKTIVKTIKPLEEKNEFEEDVPIFTWGTETLDREISPIQKHYFVVLTGLAGTGKTAFAFDIAVKNAALGHKVLFLSLEMSKSELICRCARTAAGITKLEWRGRGKTTPSYKQEIFKRKKEELMGMKNFILEQMPEGIPNTSENIFSFIETINPDLTFIDNFDLIQKDQGKEYSEQNRVAKELMDLCHNKLKPIILIHHDNAKSKLKGAGGVRGSGKVIDNADLAMTCSREWNEDATPEENSVFSIFHYKDRDFGQGKVSVAYFYKGVFYDQYPQEKSVALWTDNI